ncbi:MAG: UbiA prenyltransferase family protein [Pirellulaceae bacterium]
MKHVSATTEDSAAVESPPPTARTSARLAAYLAERFPLLAHGVLILSFYSSNQFLAHALLNPGQRMQYDVRSLMGYVATLCFFLHLRIFDDHKDFAEDCRHFPDRVLQRGVVTLEELKVLGAFAIGFELALGAWAGSAALVSVLIVFAYSLLMLKEFFVREWLRRHFVLYVSSHMLVMPLLALVVFSFSTGRYPWQAPGWYWLYSFVGFFVAFNWEVSRKIRVPEEEIDDLDSYTKLCGTYGAAYLVLAIRVVDTGLVTIVAHHLDFSVWFYAWLLILFLLCMVGFFQYRFRTTPVTARRMEKYAGFYIVAFDLALAVELVRTYGITVGGNE